MLELSLHDALRAEWATSLQIWCALCGRVHMRHEWQERGWRCPTIYCDAVWPQAIPWSPNAWGPPRRYLWPRIAPDGAYYPLPGRQPQHPIGSVVYAHSRVTNDLGR